jgi:DNA-binding GntR family transcriptional regulator
MGDDFDPRAWVQVAQSVRAQIADGERKPGDHVSIKNEADTRGCSTLTVAKALRLLAAEGTLRHIPHCGYFCAVPLD